MAASEGRGSGRSGTREASLRQRWAAHVAPRLMDGAWCASRWSAGRGLALSLAATGGGGGTTRADPPRRADLSLPPAARSCPSRPSFPLPVPADASSIHCLPPSAAGAAAARAYALLFNLGLRVSPLLRGRIHPLREGGQTHPRARTQTPPILGDGVMRRLRLAPRAACKCKNMGNHQPRPGLSERGGVAVC